MYPIEQEKIDIEFLLNCMTNHGFIATRRPKVEGILELLFDQGTIPTCTRKDTYLLYLKYEEQLPHTEIGRITGESWWNSMWGMRQIRPRLQEHLKKNTKNRT